MPFLQTLQKTGYGLFSGGGRKQILYVGGTFASSSGTTADLSISLTALTGGIGTSPQPGDMVLVAHSWGSTVDRTMVASTAGYTVIADRYSDSTYDTNLGIYYKFMSATPDTTVAVPSTVSTADSRAVAVHVWRNVNQLNPLDVATSFSNSTGTIVPTIGSKTLSATSNAMTILVCAGASGGVAPVAYSSGPTGTSNFVSAAGSDTNDCYIGIASYQPSVGEARGFTAFGSTIADNAGYSSVIANLTLQAIL